MKFLRSFAWVLFVDDDEIPPPGPSWYLGFLQRHPEVEARRAKTLGWKWHDYHIFDKVVGWFQVVGPELQF
jgi:hypothetical protein